MALTVVDIPFSPVYTTSNASITEVSAVTTKVSAKGWIVIPQELRNRFGLRQGTQVRFVDYGGVLSIVPVMSDPVAAGFGLLKGRSLTARLLEERRQDNKRENP